MSVPYIGSKISLVSRSGIRYEGILFTIDTEKSQVALQNVRSFGTEDRRPDAVIPPSVEVWDCIIFRGSDIQDLHVCEAPKPRPAPTQPPLDPAIISSPDSGFNPYGFAPYGFSPQYPGAPDHFNASGSAPYGYGAFPGYGYLPQQQQQQPPQQQQQQHPPSHLQQPAPQSGKAPTPTVAVPETKQTRSASSPVSASAPQPQPQPPSQHQPSKTQSSAQSHHQHQTSSNSQEKSAVTAESAHKASQSNSASTASSLPTNAPAPAAGARPTFAGAVTGNTSRQPAPNTSQSAPVQPPTTDINSPFDFSAANALWVKESSHLAVVEVKPGYSKSNSFFDSISCEATDKQSGKDSRVNMNEQRQLDMDTFGTSNVHGGERRGRGRGGHDGNRHHYRGGSGGGGHRGNYRGSNRGNRGGNYQPRYSRPSEQTSG